MQEIRVRAPPTNNRVPYWCPSLPHYPLTTRSFMHNSYSLFICTGCHIQKTLVNVRLSVWATHTITVLWTFGLCPTPTRDRSVRVSDAGGVVLTVLNEVARAWGKEGWYKWYVVSVLPFNLCMTLHEIPKPKRLRDQKGISLYNINIFSDRKEREERIMSIMMFCWI